MGTVWVGARPRPHVSQVTDSACIARLRLTANGDSRAECGSSRHSSRQSVVVVVVVVESRQQTADREQQYDCLLYTSPSPRDRTRSRMPSSA